MLLYFARALRVSFRLTVRTAHGLRERAAACRALGLALWAIAHDRWGEESHDGDDQNESSHFVLVVMIVLMMLCGFALLPLLSSFVDEKTRRFYIAYLYEKQWGLTAYIHKPFFFLFIVINLNKHNRRDNSQEKEEQAHHICSCLFDCFSLSSTIRRRRALLIIELVLLTPRSHYNYFLLSHLQIINFKMQQCGIVSAGLSSSRFLHRFGVFHRLVGGSDLKYIICTYIDR